MTDEYKLTKSGYLRYRKDDAGRLRLEHDLVWEAAHGPIPKGMYVHHKDHNKTNNDLSNLELVDALEHKRLHSGCIKDENGEWLKPCKVCGEYKPCTPEHWYYVRGCITGKECKKCYVKKVVEQRRIRVANGWKRKEYRK